METYALDKNQVHGLMGSLKNGDLKFHQFYNIEFALDEFAFQKFMTTFKEGDPVKKSLNKTYYDIEVRYDPAVFPDAEKAAYMVNSIAIYNNLANKATIFTVPKGCNIEDAKTLEDGVKELYQSKCDEKPTYNIPGIQIEVKTFESEIDLLKEFFLELRRLENLFLIGFNSSTFDDPYVVNRGLNLIGEEIYNYISEFKEVEKFGTRSYEWPDYLKIDILKLYKPVDQGGNGLGSSLPNYKLNTVAYEELELEKLDLEDMNEAYENDIVSFLTYNLLDTLLTFKLDEKLKFLELNWMLAKYNDSPLGPAVNGRSIMYLYRNNLIYTRQGKASRAKKFHREIFYPFEELHERYDE